MKGGWRAAFPPAQWLAAYRAQWLPRDAIAGVTLAAYGIPVSLAYASLAGLPPSLWVYSPTLVIPSLVLVEVWHWTPLVMLISIPTG